MTNIKKIKEWIKNADAIIIGAGSGLSTAAGIDYGEESFKREFPELVEHYGFTDLYTSGFYDFKTEEERWSYWAKHINHSYIKMDTKPLYKNIYELVKDKNYFVITTNVEGQFIKAGFDKDKVFETQGSLSKIQCSNACHNKLYDDVELVKEMIQKNKGVKIPSSLVPKCPVCGGEMEVNLRVDNFFVEDDYWHEHSKSYQKFINDNKDKNILLLELGVGFNTPGIIRFPFEEMTYNFKNTKLIRINNSCANVPNDIEDKAIGLNCDINDFIDKIKK